MDAGRPTGSARNGRGNLPHGEVLEIAAAAARLGITTAALRKRIKRRSVTAEKLHGRWVVYLGEEKCSHHASISETRRRPREGRGQPAEPERDGTADRDTSRALMDALQAEVAFLRRELEQRTDELRRRDSIIMALATRTPTLPIGNTESTPAMSQTGTLDTSSPRPVPASSPRVARRRLPWWRRLLAALLAEGRQRA